VLAAPQGAAPGQPRAVWGLRAAASSSSRKGRSKAPCSRRSSSCCVCDNRKSAKARRASTATTGSECAYGGTPLFLGTSATSGSWPDELAPPAEGLPRLASCFGATDTPLRVCLPCSEKQRHRRCKAQFFRVPLRKAARRATCIEQSDRMAWCDRSGREAGGVSRPAHKTTSRPTRALSRSTTNTSGARRRHGDGTGGNRHCRTRRHRRSARARRGIGSAAGTAASTPRAGEHGANQGRDHQFAHEHHLIPP
jgi:hypothetical protein